MENERIVTSATLARALNDIGVNGETIQLRRKTWLDIEAFDAINIKAFGDDVDFYIFGSQTEGTTTLDMNSDFDFLYCYKKGL
ncbi:hypothetical protein DPMN_092172 [Dreissena polymorpha]|uniref:Uncharacterized protein n=1 Tax=Dreissena polymorpha TaxID=45954 RepID=A0A9D4L1R2_DREPO|nr:hypothetical protein DPMN_092172 [Dreissena polymorpha]